MLRITVRFPLGVYHAQSVESFDEPEWPPHPLRILAALLAAAHGRPRADPVTDRAVLRQICEAEAPTILAPESVGLGEPVCEDAVARLQGATRWAPRNYFSKGKGRTPAAVNKVGVAIGDRSVHVIWPNLHLGPADLDRIGRLASEITFVGTTRSPALMEIGDAPPAGRTPDAWLPVDPDTAVPTVSIRIPDGSTMAAFDQRHGARKSTADDLQSSGMVPGIRIGRDVPYASEPWLRVATAALDPQWWGAMLVLTVDRDRSEIEPTAAASYLLARAVRVALLGAYGRVGTPAEAPPILRARDDIPHCAVVPLPHVSGQHADGRILGVAIVLPHEGRVEDLAAQRRQVESGLHQLAVGTPEHPQRYVQIPEAGRIWLANLDPARARLVTLREASYRGPARGWVTATPVVHSRWRKGGVSALLDQVTSDCVHVGLPAPDSVESLRGPAHGGDSRLVPIAKVPEAWRGLLSGPLSHLRITFPVPVHGPLLLGRARHFGLGLLVPDDQPEASGREPIT